MPKNPKFPDVDDIALVRALGHYDGHPASALRVRNLRWRYLLDGLLPSVVQLFPVSTHPLQEPLLLRGWQSAAKNDVVREFDHDLTIGVVRVQVRWGVVSEVNSDRDAEKLANLGHTQKEPRPSDILVSLQPQTVLSAEHLRNHICSPKRPSTTLRIVRYHAIAASIWGNEPIQVLCSQPLCTETRDLRRLFVQTRGSL